jgi:hypothetical protein
MEERIQKRQRFHYKLGAGRNYVPESVHKIIWAINW